MQLMKPPGKLRRLFVAGALATVAASMCCGVPVVLLTLGVGGAWIGFSTMLDAFRPVFAGVTLLIFAFSFYRLYWVAHASEPGCRSSRKLKRQRLAFWLVAALALGLMVGVSWLMPRCLP